MKEYIAPVFDYAKFETEEDVTLSLPIGGETNKEAQTPMF